MRRSYEQQIDESRSKTDKSAESDAEYINKREGRSTLKGVFDREKKPVKGVELLHDDAITEDELREESKQNRSDKVEKDEKTGLYKKDITDGEKMRVIREKIGQILPENFVEELSWMKKKRMTDRATYESVLNRVFVQANGGEDVWGRKSKPHSAFEGWSANDCKEFLKDLGEDIELHNINNTEQE